MSVNDVDGGIKKNVCGHGMAAAMSRAEGAHAAERADKEQRLEESPKRHLVSKVQTVKS